MQRAQSLVIVLLTLAGLIAATSAVRHDELSRETLSDGGSPADPWEDIDTSFAPDHPANGPVADLDPSPDALDVDGDGPRGSTDAGSPAPSSRGEPTPPEGASPGDPPPGTVAPTGEPIKLAYVVLDAEGAGALTGRDTGAREGSAAHDAAQEFEALIEWVNANDGIHGRPVEGRGFMVSLSEAADENAQVRRCIEITEDWGAHYVLDTAAINFPAAQGCFAQRRTVYVGAAQLLDEDLLRRFRPYLATTRSTLDSELPMFVPKLQEAGYLEPGVRLGLLLDDVPQVERAYQRILLPALQRAGFDPVVERARFDDTAQHANAVLRFRTAGVTHVSIVGISLHILGFTNAAEAQGYRPRYAFPDYGGAAAAAVLTAPPAQLENAVAVSACNAFHCIVDTPDRHSGDNTTPYDPARLSPGWSRCLDTLSEARGRDYYNPSSAGASLYFALICDHFLLWLDAARAARPDVQPSTWYQGLQRLGGSYQSPVIHTTEFGDGRQSGAAATSTGIYNQSCQCYVRNTPWTRASR